MTTIPTRVFKHKGTLVYPIPNPDNKPNWDLDTKDPKIRRILLKIFKQNYRHLYKGRSSPLEENVPGLINYWRQYWSKSELDGWYDIYLFDSGSIEDVKETLELMDFPVDGVDIHSDYDCTGRVFYRSCSFTLHEIANRVLVTQSGGYDV